MNFVERPSKAANHPHSDIRIDLNGSRRRTAESGWLAVRPLPGNWVRKANVTERCHFPKKDGRTVRSSLRFPLHRNAEVSDAVSLRLVEVARPNIDLD